MQLDLILGGVGGQGILSIAFVLDNASLAHGLHLKQSEVHGMAQRGGAVSSHLRISDDTIYSDMVPRGGAQLLLSVEPMEALRYLEHLAPDGRVVASTSPEVNIPDYPEPEALLRALVALPGTVLLNGRKVAREAGSHRAQNMVILGAAAPYIPLPEGELLRFVHALFERKGEKVISANVNAFRYGRSCGQFYARCVERGADPFAVLALMDHLESSTVDPSAAEAWCRVLADGVHGELARLFVAEPRRAFPAGADVAEALLRTGIGALPAPRADG